MATRYLFRGTLAVVLSLVSFAAPQAWPDESRPNVIFIFSDQHRMASFPGEPHTSVIAPNMQHLAEQGATFVNAISNYPVCSPFRAMLLTGRAPYTTGVIDNSIPLNDDGTSIGHIFSRAGYKTGYIGKWHLGVENSPAQGTHGFDEFEIWRNTNDHQRSRYWDAHQKKYIPYDGYNATGMVDHALNFIARHKDEPMLLYLSLNPPHSNFHDAPAVAKALYEGTQLQERPNRTETLAEPYPDWAGRGWSGDVHRGYLAHISAIDTEIGRILRRLNELGLEENTIVLYSSDHGEMMWSHGRIGKRVPFEESIRIPFVVRWPKAIKAGLRPEGLIGVIDFVPTLLGLVGIHAPQDMDGHDQSNVLRGKKIKPPAFQPIMHIQKSNASKGNRHPAELFRGVRTSRYTYAVTSEGPWLLFDLKNDPYQLENLIDRKKYAAQQRRLHAMTRKWLRTYEDPFKL